VKIKFGFHQISKADQISLPVVSGKHEELMGCVVFLTAFL
jgi:hypothetical protein